MEVNFPPPLTQPDPAVLGSLSCGFPLPNFLSLSLECQERRALWIVMNVPTSSAQGFTPLWRNSWIIRRRQRGSSNEPTTCQSPSLSPLITFQNDFHQARTHYEAALQMEPQNEVLLGNMRKLDRAQGERLDPPPTQPNQSSTPNNDLPHNFRFSWRWGKEGEREREKKLWSLYIYSNNHVNQFMRMQSLSSIQRNKLMCNPHRIAQLSSSSVVP